MQMYSWKNNGEKAEGSKVFFCSIVGLDTFLSVRVFIQVCENGDFEYAESIYH